MIHKKLQNLKNLGKFHIKNIALNTGVLESHSDYCKFIILGKGRSGSNFLRGLLNSHSQIITFGELFRDDDFIGWEFPTYDRYLQSPKIISLRQNQPVTFLKNKVFNKYPKQISAVGFKLFYYHAQDDSRQVVWSFLKEQQNIKIIHLKRNNTLRELLSLRKAFITNKWTNIDGSKDKQLSITLDYQDCLQEFTYSQKIKQYYDLFFKENLKIDVNYEVLSNDYLSEIKRIQDFLEVDYEFVKPSTFKQSAQPLSEAISNYFELKEKFKNTPWEFFFEE
jgi:LPS sulfotransferase NodH